MPTIKVATLNLFNRMGSGGCGRRSSSTNSRSWRRTCWAAGSRPGAGPGDLGQPPDQQAARRAAALRIKHATNPDTRASFHAIATLARVEFQEHEILDLMTFERVAQRFVFKCGDRPFVFVNTHLHYPPEAQQERVEQLNYLLAWLDRDTRGLPVVIAATSMPTPNRRSRR